MPLNSADINKNKEEGIQQAIVFSLGEQNFGVDVLDSREIIALKELTKIPEAPDFVEGVIDLRGEIVPIVDLFKRLKLAGDFKDNGNKVIIVSAGGTLLGIRVDEVKEIIRINDQDISETPDIIQNLNSSYIEGVARFNEKLLVILNLNRVFSPEEINNLKELA